MTDSFVIADWAKIRAYRRSYPSSSIADNEIAAAPWGFPSALTQLALTIQKYEKPPVDRDLACAREAASQNPGISADLRKKYKDGELDFGPVIKAARLAIQLYESGFGEEK